MPAASERSLSDSMSIFPSRGSIRLAELRQPSSTRIEALVLAGGRRQLLWFETDGPPVQESADPFLPILLPAAMAAGLRLQIDRCGCGSKAAAAASGLPLRLQHCGCVSRAQFGSTRKLQLQL